jgi:O-antigen ligase
MPSRRQVGTLLGFLFAGAAIEALIGLGQFLLGIGPEAFAIGRFMRAYGTFEQPNPYAGYLGMLLPVMVAVLLSRPGPRTKRAVMGVGLLTVAAVGASLSRGAWVGIGLGAATMMVFWGHRSRLLLAIGIIAAVPVAALAFLNLLPVELSARLATALDYFRFIDVRSEVITSDNWAVLERVAHWQAAVDMIAANPIFGVGAGNYPAVYEQYMVAGWKEPLGHAHNYYLNMAAETGLTGLGLYLILLGTAFASVIAWLLRYREARTGDLFWRAILLGVLGALVAASVHNLFDNLFVHGMSVQLGMLLAMAQVAAVSLAASVSATKDK